MNTKEYTENYVNILTEQLKDKSLDEHLEGVFSLDDVAPTITDVFKTFQQKKYLTSNATRTFEIIKDKLLPSSSRPLYFTCMWTTAANDGVSDVPALFSNQKASNFLLYQLAKRQTFLPSLVNDLEASLVSLNSQLHQLPTDEEFYHGLFTILEQDLSEKIQGVVGKQHVFLDQKNI